MRIEEFPLMDVSARGPALATNLRLEKNSGRTGAGGDDRVRLSRLARLARGFDSERLEALRHEVNAGVYQAPTATTSRKIIDYYLLG